MAFALHEVHAVEAEGFYFDESLGAGDLGPGDVVDEHVFDGAFTGFDVCDLEVRLVVVVVGGMAFVSLATCRYAPIALMVAILNRSCVLSLRWF